MSLLRMLPLVVGMAAATGAAQQQTPTFRASVDEVLIDVSVMDGRRPVQGLTMEDFVLEDNGVTQRLAAATLDSGPIDVAIVPQRSGNAAGLPSTFLAALDAAVNGALEDLGSILMPGDHVDVLPAERLRGPTGMLGRVRGPQHASSILDELTAAMMLAPSAPGRRRLIVAITGGVRERSAVPEPARLEVARRTDAVLYLVSLGDNAPTQSFGFGRTGVLTLGGRGALPLEPVSEASGGRTYRVGRSTKIVDVLGDAITEFRTRYLLRYTPTGVPREGWHEVRVRVTSGGLDVRHRRGYEIMRQD